MDQQEQLFETGVPPRARLRNKPITEREWLCIQASLSEFNRQAGMRLGVLRGDGRLSDAATRIGMRIREWPNLTEDDLRTVVRRGFQRQWWKGRPTVGVIFSPQCFEPLVHAQAPREDEFESYLRSLAGHDVEATAVEV